MCDMLGSDDWKRSREVNGAEIWFRDYFNGHERTDSDAIYEFALNRWETCITAKQVIDGKADAILKFIGILAAATVTIAKIVEIQQHHVLYVMPAVAFFCLCAIMALATMRASEWPSPINIRTALEECDNNPQRQKTQLAASLNWAIVGATVELKRKARLLDGANACAVAGIIALAFVLFV